MRTTLFAILLFVPMLLLAQNIGINTQFPRQQFDVDGKIQVGDDNAPPTAGAIRFNSANSRFEGYNGASWVPLDVTGFGGGGGSDANKTIHGVGLDDGDRFGASVNMFQQKTLVGAPEAGNSGKVFLFEHKLGCWGEMRTLFPFLGTATDESFGASVALNADWIVVGAPGGNSDQGKVYIFNHNQSYTSNASFESNQGLNTRYGSVISLNQNTLAVGASWEDSQRGTVYMYHYDGTNWTYDIKTFPSVPTGTSAEYGASVLLRDGYLFVSAPLEQAVYVYTFFFNIPALHSKIDATWLPQGTSMGRFGDKIDYDNGYLMISAPFSDPNGLNNAGSVHVFKLDNNAFSHHQELIKPAGLYNDIQRFGQSLTIDNGQLLIGCPGSNDYGYNSGAAYLYSFDGTLWTFERELINPDKYAFEQFGSPMSLYDGKAAIGIPYSGAQPTGKILFIEP